MMRRLEEIDKTTGARSTLSGEMAMIFGVVMS
jgi:hypothetical protein